MAIEIVDSNPNEPIRIMPYSEEGLGKSTLGAMAEKVIFLPTENGASRLKDRDGRPVKLFKGITSWDTLMESVNWLRTKQHDFRSVCLDSATAAEKMSHTKIVGTTGKSIVTVDKGYGAGYAKAVSMHVDLIAALEELRQKKEMNIIVTAHAQVKTVKDPEMVEDYDQFELKLHKDVAGLWREYVDCLFFIRLNTMLKLSDDARARAMTDMKRIIYTQKTPAFQAKSRFAMPPKMEYTIKPAFWDTLMTYVNAGHERVEPEKAEGEIETNIADEIALNQEISTVQSDIMQLIALVPDETKKKATLDYVEKAGNDLAKLHSIQKRLKEVTQTAQAAH